MRPPSICGKCSKVHYYIPFQAKEFEDSLTGGWYWECDFIDANGEICNSTIWVPSDEAKANIAKLKETV